MQNALRNLKSVDSIAFGMTEEYRIAGRECGYSHREALVEFSTQNATTLLEAIELSELRVKHLSHCSDMMYSVPAMEA